MKVLIAVDDDTESQDAIRFARDTLPHDAEVIVLNVAQYAVTAAGTMGTFAMGSYGDAMLTTETQERLAATADAGARRTVEQAGDLIDADDYRVAHGDVGPTVCDVAAHEGVDLVVLGTHDRGRFARWWFGSVSDHVVHNAPCSVLVVR
jgi:nucleotide-binding universal stress UspA family protein